MKIRVLKMKSTRKRSSKCRVNPEVSPGYSESFLKVTGFSISFVSPTPTAQSTVRMPHQIEDNGTGGGSHDRHALSCYYI